MQILIRDKCGHMCFGGWFWFARPWCIPSSTQSPHALMENATLIVSRSTDTGLFMYGLYHGHKRFRTDHTSKLGNYTVNCMYGLFCTVRKRANIQIVHTYIRTQTSVHTYINTCSHSGAADF